MNCPTVIYCEPKATREEKLSVDVLVVGGGLGGLVAALELKKYGYEPKVGYVGRLGGHHILGDVPRFSDDVDIEIFINRAGNLDVSQGFFDGIYLYSGGVRYRMQYRHLVLATGGVDVPIAFPSGHKAPQKTAEEVLAEPPTGRKIVVWGTTEWGLRTALTLRNRGNDVVVLDNSATLRDTKYFEKVKSKIDFPVITAVRVKEFQRGAMVLEVVTGKKENEVRRLDADLIVSAVRVVNSYIPAKLGFKVYYSFELGSLLPRRSNYGELLIVDDRGKAVGGSYVYATGHLYGAVRERHIVEHAKLLAKYIAAKDGVESLDNVKDALDKFLVTLTVEANWLYNLSNRLERGTDGTGRYVEPNVIDVPFWASYWPQIEEAGEVIVCPCDNTPIERVLREVMQLNRMRELKVKVTHEETDLLRQMKLPRLSFGDNVCAESICLTYASIMLGALLSQRPFYFLYGKPEMLYGEVS